MFDLYWSLLPSMSHGVAARLAAYIERCGGEDLGAGPAADAQRDGLMLQVANGVAIIPIMGALIRRAGGLASYFGLVGTDNVRLALNAAIADNAVEKILLRIDSPGGSVSGISELAAAVAGSPKPVTAQVEGMAASAALWIASQADRVVVGDNDLVGSIGARILMFDLSKAFENAGIEAVAIDTGEYKSAGAEGTAITKAQRADFQRLVDFYGDEFIKAVASGRSMSVDDVRKLADGRMFTPREAIENGLIDGVSTLSETLGEMIGNRKSRRIAKARLRM